MENLDRGVVAVVVTGGVYVGWRMLGYEYTGTDSDTTYNLYRDGTKIASVDATGGTNYLDASGTATSKYTVTCVLKGTEGAQSPAVTPWAQQYLTIPLTAPTDPTSNGATYTPNDGAPGDLNGDGILDLVLKWDPSNSHDNAQSGNTSDVFIDGYALPAGTRLWRIDLGPNIRAGAHYTQMSVYDFDGDGKAELIVKTAPGTKDGTGAYLAKGTAAGADNTQKYANSSGYILTGPEWVTAFAGDTGAELDTMDYPVQRGTVSAWGDAYGNRVDRFNGGFSFVKDNGVATGLPSAIQGRGYYTRLTVSAITFRSGAIAKNWVYDSVTPLNPLGVGGGCHSEMSADTDGDLGMEIIPGESTIDSAGTLKCQTELGHGDALDVGELVPGQGITTFQIHEGMGGMDAHVSATCKTYFQTTEPGTDSNRGRAEYVGAGDETSASCYCGSCTEHLALCATGSTSVTISPGTNFLIYWDADLWRETENAATISKPGGATLLDVTGYTGNNSTKETPTLTADMIGDWREELIVRPQTGSADVRMYTTTTVTTNRLYTLMHDPTYRSQVNFENSAYNQPPHTSWRISPNMNPAPVPNIFVVK
jgi:hypothetical protein